VTAATPARPRLGKALATVGLWTMASRVLGFARDVAIAGTLGASPVAEAFLLAFRLPNMFRRFFAEGAFNMAFVPLFTKKLPGEETDGAAGDRLPGAQASPREAPDRGEAVGSPSGMPAPGEEAASAPSGAPAREEAASRAGLRAAGEVRAASSEAARPPADAGTAEAGAAAADLVVVPPRPDAAGGSALDFARDAFSGLAAILVAFTLLCMAAMPWLVLLLAGGFRGDERFDLAVLYGRIAFPYILLISLAALLSGVLNALGRFVAAAAAPVLLNVLFLAALGLAAALGWDPGLALSWTVPLAGAAQLALVWWAAGRAGYRLVPRRPRITPELRRLAIIAAPAALSGGVVQVNLLVGTRVASEFEGAIAWLSYADRLYQLPLGVVGIAIGVVLLPDLSRRLRDRDARGGRMALSRAGEVAMALTLPAAVALCTIPGPLVAVLFERGAFGAEDAAATALAVAVYGAGLPAFVLQKVLQPLYFARHDTRRPFRYAVAALVVNAALAIGLAPFIGFIAAAWGTTVAGWAMLWLLWRGTADMGEVARPDPRFWSRLARIALASAAMGAVLWTATALAGGLLAGPLAVPALAGLVALGMASYALAGRALGAFSPHEIRSALRR
jgi:putative peptidoglycan lipid II flippase